MRTLVLLVLGLFAIPVLAPDESSFAEAGTGPFASFDSAMTTFMAPRGIHAATLAVSWRGELLFEQGYGTMTRGGSVPVPGDAPFRLASVSKPLTASAVKLLIAEGTLSPLDRAFCTGQLLPPPLKCHLTHSPPPLQATDPRLGSITIQHLLDHRGGFDRYASFDPMFRAIEIAQALGVPSPPTQDQVVRYMVGQPLDFSPGAYTAYSNFGYVVLGLIVEKVSGMDLPVFLKTRIFVDPLEGKVAGHTVPRDLFLGRTLLPFRDAREPRYNCDHGGQGRNVFDPSQFVCWADGGWHLEAMEGAGGLVANGRTIAWFLDRYWIGGDPRPLGSVPARIPEFEHWFFYGSLDGTWTLARQHSSGLNYVALFNQRGDGSGLAYEEIRTSLDAAATTYMASAPLVRT